MAEVKTKLNQASVQKFIDGLPDKETRQDCRTLVEIMQQAAKAPSQMWGSSVVGFGSYHYKYGSGREGDWPLVGFSPRKQNLTL